MLFEEKPKSNLANTLDLKSNRNTTITIRTMNSEFMSFYIPYIRRTWTEDEVIQVFTETNVGVVERIDFVDYGRWPDAISCFVHLSAWEDNEYADSIYNEIMYVSGSFRLYLPNFPGKYFILRKMTGEKLPTTHMNIHQLAAKIAAMEEYIITHILGQQEDASLEHDASLEEEHDASLEEDYEIEVVDDETICLEAEYNHNEKLAMEQIVHQTAAFHQQSKNLGFFGSI
jgi:hypothetical protein